MGGNKALAAAGLACLCACWEARRHGPIEPFWNPRPLSHWVAVLQSGDPAARTKRHEASPRLP